MEAAMTNLREAIADACREAGYDQSGGQAEKFWKRVDAALAQSRLECQQARELLEGWLAASADEMDYSPVYVRLAEHTSAFLAPAKEPDAKQVP
jgi:hypothetical protein